MKKTGFRKQSYAEKLDKIKAKVATKSVKKITKKVKKKTSNVSLLKKKLWELCKQIIRTKYGNTCYTCGKTGLAGASWHTGHFLASSVCGAYLRYDLRNLRPQCYYCNINCGGSGAMFYKNLVDREGQKFVDEIFIDKQKSIKADELFYAQKISEYEKILATLQ